MKASHEVCGDWVEFEELILGADGKIRGVCMKVVSIGGQIKITRRPMNYTEIEH